MDSSTTTTTTSQDPPSNVAASKKNTETSLSQLTKRFVKLLNSSPERIVNLNEASSRLSVAKRRIYDITNVLEGIGMLQKTSKNVTKWIDCPNDSPFAAPPSSTITTTTTTTTTAAAGVGGGGGGGQVVAAAADSLANNAELLVLSKNVQSLDEAIDHLKADIRQQLSGEGAYVTYHDIKSYFSDQIVIAVKAPPGTRLEVNENLQIWMKAENAEIEVYLCPQYCNGTNNADNAETMGGVSSDDPILTSVGEEDPFEPLVARDDSNYNFMLDEEYSISSLFPEDNLGLY